MADETAGGDVAAVHPRMRSRRIRVRRDEGRRRLRRVTLVLGALAVLVGAVALSQTPLFDVDRVRVEGVEGARADEVLEAADIADDQALLSLDGGAVAGRVEALPWVATAQVARSWPATVRVRVTPREVVAAVQVTGETVAFVDGEGVVVTIGPGPSADAGDVQPLALTGIEGRVAVGERLDDAALDAITVARAVIERMPDGVASVSTDLEAELVDGGVVRFGSTEELDEKITAVKTVLSEVDVACLAALDVRVPASPALTRHQGCS
jgi:cell division protein FtsQ